MPIAKIQLQDGRIAKFEVPEGTTEQDVMSYVSDNIDKFQTKVPKVESESKSGRFSNINMPFISNEKAQQNIERGIQDSEKDKRLLETPYKFAGGALEGLGNALVGAVQTGSDIIAPESKFGSRLADSLKKSKQEQANLSIEEKAGIFIGELAPYVAGTAQMGLLKGAATSGFLSSFLAPKEEQSDLKKRTLEGGESAAQSLAAAGVLKGAGSLLTSEASKKLLGKTKEFTEGLKNRIISQFGSGEASKEASKTITEKTLRKGFEAEGLTAKEVLDNLQGNNLDLIDALDPRFATYGRIKGSLTTPENIRKIDASLTNIKQSTDDLQKSLTNMVATKQLTPEEAGEVLGRNSKKIFDRAIEARKAKADPFYTRGLNKGTKIDVNSPVQVDQQTLKALGVEKLTLNDILKSEIGQDIISTARGQAKVFAKTPGGKFYGQLDQKTQPVYKNIKKLSNSDIGGAPNYITEQILEKPSTFKIPDNDVRSLHAMENVLSDRIGNIKLTGASKEEAALIATKTAISDLLNKANPELAKARSIWSDNTKQIMSEGKSQIGKYAKWYNEGRLDELAKASTNILDLPERAMKLYKKQSPEDFDQVLRSSIENKLSSIKPLDDSVIKSKPFYSALFSDKGKNLKTALGNDELFSGFKKLATQLDRGAKRQALARSAAESQAKAVNIATGKTSFINRVLEKTADTLMNSPNSQTKLVDYALTDEGINFLKNLAKEQSAKETEKQLTNFVVKSGIISADDIVKILATSVGKRDLLNLIPNNQSIEKQE